MISSQMYFDKPNVGENEVRRGARRTAKPRRNRADSIPRHGATDPYEKYSGPHATYYGTQAIFSTPAEQYAQQGHSSVGDAMWDIYNDHHPAKISSVKEVKSSSTSNGGGAYWDIYDDNPSYKGPSYRDLRKKQNSGEKKKGYEMRRSAPIDSPFTMVTDTGSEDLQKPSVQKTVRPDGGLSFSRWEGDQQNPNYSFLK
mmetsp:Transcript_19328/g.28858  ORF Transcript_19328/g.28858 Transcript_19328/m.28858 type:complete len:199 (+) Transcript_19328:116-712(+)|eukprot:CAMPEP_0167747064 /NCGR_PEP_ID=MMETSP0110_2-20121227/4066_1 /TAXON_ID=629695 /ORGANISM="Gymnochlora sp., Strain CCMP2014" /LENGTH=198 /DNA_ID=CAMNT_0007631909 /DNA_START=127 /DNA_END=723 /DNA_ORIENTATION=+